MDLVLRILSHVRFIAQNVGGNLDNNQYNTLDMVVLVTTETYYVFVFSSFRDLDQFESIFELVKISNRKVRTMVMSDLTPGPPLRSIY